MALRKPIHEAAQKRNVEFGRAFCMDLFLDVRDIERYKAGGVGEACKLAGELLDFLLCPVVGVGIAVEMEKFDAHAALCHHITRDGRIDAARDEEHPLARRADGHAADARLERRKDERGAVFADVEADSVLRGVDVHLQSGVLVEKVPPNLGIELHGSLGVLLVGAVSIHLEGALLRADIEGGLKQLPHRGARRKPDRIGMHAEDAGDAVANFLGAVFVETGDEIAAAHTVQLVSETLQGALQIDGEDALEISPVLAF